MQIVTLPALLKTPTMPFFFVLPDKFPVLWLAKRILLLAGDVESNSGLTSVCTVQCMGRGVLHWTVHPDGSPGPMDKPHQSDSFAGHMEGQIAGTAFGSVGASLYKHERRRRKQRNNSYYMYHCARGAVETFLQTSRNSEGNVS